MEQNNKIVVLTLSGNYISLEEWQKRYGLTIGSTQIGKHFSYTEHRFQQDLADYGVLVVCEPHIMVADRFRDKWGKPVTFSSFNRNDEKQDALRKEEEELNKLLPEAERTHTRAITSPHVAKMAGDIDLLTRAEVNAAVPVLREAAKELNIKIRIGYKEYLQKSESIERSTGRKDEWTFMHFDVCPEFFAKGRVFHTDPHPVPWEFAIEW
jgi:hypothetical protein